LLVDALQRVGDFLLLGGECLARLGNRSTCASIEPILLTRDASEFLGGGFLCRGFFVRLIVRRRLRDWRCVGI